MIKKLSSSSLKVICLFVFWRISLLIILLLAIKLVPLAQQDRFLGGGFVNYNLSPGLFSWANFDGEHYLSIAIFGYKGLEQVFFPVFPMLISFFSHPFSSDLFTSLVSSTIVGLIISNGCFLLALLYLFELLKLDFSNKFSFLVISLILVFPTSFYFGSLYNESLFLLLTVLSFLNARRGNWFLASVFGFVSAGTRIFGIFLFPALLIEAYIQKKYKGIFWLFLIPLGLGLYMYYQYVTVGDPLAFYHLQDMVGEQRQANLVLLPQVYFRYLKMLVTVDPHNFIYQTVVLEFICGLLFFALPLYGYFKRIRISYLLYAFVGFLITTVQGSFSSVPRYVLVFFPSFIALAFLIGSLPRIIKVLLYFLMSLLLAIETALFLRGYWIA